MKKIYILFFLLTVGLIIKANPIALPTIEISELYFDEAGNWKLELGYYEVNQNGFTIDSIFLFSSTDTIKLPTYEFLGSTGVMVITADSLDSEFQINRIADTIRVISYTMEEPFEDILIFGNIAGSSINYPRQGQSICKYRDNFVKDKSPTIGFLNDTTGIMGTLKGVVYSKYSEAVENQLFYFKDCYLETFANGEYSTRVYSKPSVLNYLTYETQIDNWLKVSIAEISYTMEPDSVVELNIHLLDTLTTGINDLRNSNTLISVYPNPISKNGELNINIDLPIITSDIYIEIIDLNGKMIKKKKISKNSSSIIAPDKSGLYIVRTLLDSEIISTNRIIVNE